MTNIEGINKTILDSIGDGILVIDRDYNIILINKAILQLCEVKEDNVIGQKCHKFSHHCPLPCYKEGKTVVCPHREVFKTGKPMSVPHSHIMPDGTEKIFDITASAIKDEKGDVIQMIEVLRDVTEKKEAMRESESSKAFFASVLDGMDEALVVVDKDFKIITTNEVFLKQRKNALNSIIGRYCYEISHNFDRPCYEKGKECPVKQTFETGEHSKVIHIHYDKEGNPIYVNINSHPVRDSSGKIISAIECITDITEKVNLENEVKKRIKELEEFYDMAVGRELKMTELKEEIERLKEELKKRR